jgi:phosphatidylglycerophosphatase A
VLVTVGLLGFLYSIGVIAIRDYQKKTGLKDAGEIVYDEFFGQTLTYVLVTAFYLGLAYSMGGSLNPEATPVDVMLFSMVPFIYFRIFDIAKPWPIWVIDKKDNRPSGVMLDDVVAAIYAAAASIITFFIIGSCCPNL